MKISELNDADLSEKMTKKLLLNQRIKANIKRALIVIAIGVIIFILLSLQWQKYQEKINNDKRFIQNHNQRLIYDAMSSLENINQISRHLIFDLDATENLVANRHSDYNKLYQLSGFHYDNQRYPIDRIQLTELFQMEREAIEYALELEALSEETKSGLAAIILANERIIDDLQGILKAYIYDEEDMDKRTMKEYLYFYKGEILYLFTNAMAVYGADLDFTFIEYDEVKVDEAQDELLGLTEEGAIRYRDKITNIIRGKQLVFVSENENTYYQGDATRLNWIRFEAQDDSLDKVDVYADGIISYDRGIDVQAIKRKEVLPMDEVILVADDFIEQLPQKDLQLQYSNVYYRVESSGKNIGTCYYFTYVIRTEDYRDESSYVTLMYHESGELINVVIKNMAILEGTYAIDKVKSQYISKEVALEVIPEEKRKFVEGMLLNTSAEAWYGVSLREYDVVFKFIVDALTGELLRIER